VTGWKGTFSAMMHTTTDEVVVLIVKVTHFNTVHSMMCRNLKTHPYMEGSCTLRLIA